MDDPIYRASLARVIKGSISLLVLYFGASLLPKLPGMSNGIAGLPLGNWVRIAIAVVAAGVLTRVLGPAKAVGNVLVTSLWKPQMRADQVRYEQSASQFAAQIVNLLALVIVFAFLSNPIRVVATSVLRTHEVYTAVTLLAAVLGVVLAINAWRSVQPLIDMASERLAGGGSRDLTDQVTCDKCGELNQHGRRFCGSCGARLEAVRVTPAPPPTPEG